MKNHAWATLRAGCLGVAVSITCIAQAAADVTIQQKSTLDVASMIRMHGESTTVIATGRKRQDTDAHCEGIMSLLCRNLKGGEIVRLDRGITWYLQPDKKRYREQAFATPEELAVMRAKMRVNLEKMRSCPVSEKQQPIDKSKCEMSAPKIEVHKTGDKMTIAGHDVQRTLATLTETCTNKDSGDVCDTVVAVDVWLTQDAVPGIADRRAFDQAYAKKLGLDDTQGFMPGEMAKYLAPYQAQIRQLTDKSSDLKGLPLKTSLRVMLGGAQCGATSKMQANSSSSADAGGSNSMNHVAQAGKALGSSVSHLVGGLFHKKKADDSQDAATAATPADSATTSPGGAPSPATAAPAIPDPYAQLVQMATFTLETVSISTDAIAADRFEVPPDWKKEETKSANSSDDEFTCPKT
jgi:hypothetical protein